ncbi:MAG: hypothetical protein AAF327_16320, partial [Cyanobacteria bacterium P01_A01_bin.37]
LDWQAVRPKIINNPVETWFLKFMGLMSVIKYLSNSAHNDFAVFHHEGQYRYLPSELAIAQFAASSRSTGCLPMSIQLF